VSPLLRAYENSFSSSSFMAGNWDSRYHSLKDTEQFKNLSSKIWTSTYIS
jgi:hypothetical protein